MKIFKPVSLLFSLTVLLFPANAQQAIFLTNASFEGNPGHGMLPGGWRNCALHNYTPPDVLPVKDDPAGVTTQPFEGGSYLGLIVRENVTSELVGQKLSSPLVEGQCYALSLYLCHSDTFTTRGVLSGWSSDFSHPAVLRIWGGRSLCGKKMMLAESPPIENTAWRKYTFQFRALDSLTYLTLEAFFIPGAETAYNGHILVDNASPVIPLDCEGLKPALNPDTLILPSYSFRKLNEMKSARNYKRMTTRSGYGWVQTSVENFTIVEDPSELENIIQMNCGSIGFRIGQTKWNEWERSDLREVAFNVGKFKEYRLVAALPNYGEKITKKRTAALKRTFRSINLSKKQYRIEVVAPDDDMPGWYCGERELWLKLEKR
jgi:hypothetical protein